MRKNLREKNPKVALIESIRSIGYSFQSALADIIDNSISANAKEIQIFFDPQSPAIIIFDDGKGMDYSELDTAMDLGSKDPIAQRDSADMGRFGIGLKSSSFSQCRKLTVVSKKEGSINSMTWDLDLVREENEWVILENTKEEINRMPQIDLLNNVNSGTYILWEKFDRIESSSTNTIYALEKLLNESNSYLGLVFHKFTKKGIKISINNIQIKQIDPFLTKRLDTQTLKTQQIIIKDRNGTDRSIKVTPYVLPHINNLTHEDKELVGGIENLKRDQGFYIYRNNRLIIWGTWFKLVGANELYKNARVEVEIPNSLDDIWNIDIKKSSASIPEKIRTKLHSAVKESIGSSKKIYEKRARNKARELGFECVWNTFEDRDNVYFKINRNLPILNEINNLSTEKIKDLLEILFDDIENNLPKMKIYTTIAQNPNNEPEEERFLVKEKLMNIMEKFNYLPNHEFEDLIDKIVNCEPYCYHSGIRDEVLGEMKKNGD